MRNRFSAISGPLSTAPISRGDRIRPPVTRVDAPRYASIALVTPSDHFDLLLNARNSGSTGCVVKRSRHGAIIRVAATSSERCARLFPARPGPNCPSYPPIWPSLTSTVTRSLLDVLDCALFAATLTNRVPAHGRFGAVSNILKGLPLSPPPEGLSTTSKFYA